MAMRLGVGAVLASGCSDSVEPILRPSVPSREPGRPQAAAGPISCTFAPTNSNGALSVCPLGNYPNSKVLHLTASGAITSVFGPTFPAGIAGQFNATYDPAGAYRLNAGCSANVELTGGIASSYGVNVFCYPFGGSRPFDIAVIVKDASSIRWRPGPDDATSHCGPAGAACYTFNGGSQFVVLVQEVSVVSTLSPASATVTSGQPVTMTASISPNEFIAVTVPFKILTWTYVVDGGGPVPLPQTCTPINLPTPEVCSFSPTASGTLTFSALANGDTVQNSSHVYVDGDDRFIVDCPASVVRGLQVSCTGNLTSRKAFTVVRRVAQKSSGSGPQFIVQNDTAISVPANAPVPVVWAGDAVSGSIVTVNIMTTSSGGGQLPLSGSDGFAVASRGWPLFQFGTGPAMVNYVLDNRVSDAHLMTPYPAVGSATGRFRPVIEPLFNLDTANVRLPLGGPNAGLVYFVAPLGPPSYSISIHPAYKRPPVAGSDAWRLDQNGGMDPNWAPPRPFCSQSANLDRRGEETERHEGVTKAANSHYGLFQMFFQSVRLDQYFEQAYRKTQDRGSFYFDNGMYWQAQLQAGAAQQVAFDSSDYLATVAALWNELGCVFDNDPNNY